MDFKPYTSNIFGVDLKGQPVRARAGVPATQTRIDTSVQYTALQKVHAFHRQNNPNVFDGEMYGFEVNHSTVVWYVQDEAITLL